MGSSICDCHAGQAVHDLEERLDSLVEKGAKVRIGLVTGPGGKQVLIDDPDGNPIELFDPNMKI